MAGHTEWIDKHLVMGEEAENLRREIAALFRTKTRDEWAAAAKKLDICITPVLDISEVEADLHLQARQMICEQVHPACGRIREIGVPLKFSETRPRPCGPSPALGQDTIPVLEEIGYQPEEIEELLKAGIILIPS
jgi:crotonobetainyl-CoA:carnitine CoA-transferase CaiB-like acyl-CoA transferase